MQVQPVSAAAYVSSFLSDVVARLGVLAGPGEATVAMATSDAAVLATALCRSMRLRARLVCSLAPTPLHPVGLVFYRLASCLTFAGGGRPRHRHPAR